MRSKRMIPKARTGRLKRLLMFFRRFAGFDDQSSGGELYYVNGAQSLPPPLTAEEESVAFKMLATDFNRARDILVEHNLRLVVYISKKYESTGICLEDLIGIGTLGLIKAAQSFKPDKNFKFATYASRCIDNEILMHIRANGKVKLEVSLDEPLNTDWDGNVLQLSDILGTPENIVDAGLDSETEKEILAAILARMPSRDRYIIMSRYGLSGVKVKTQKDLAVELDISQSYISRLEKRILRDLRLQFDKSCNT